MKVVGIRQTAVVSEDFAGLASGRRYAVQASRMVCRSVALTRVQWLIYR